VLEQGIALHKNDSQLYGYLADAHYLNGHSEWARICYREAFVIDPKMWTLILSKTQ
jgi:hypothetical protein